MRPSQSTNATSVGSWRWCRQADALRTRSESSEYKEAQRPHHHSPLLRRCSCSKCSDPRTGRWRSGMMSVGGRTHFWLEFLPFTPGFIPLQVQTRQTCRSLPNFPLPVGRVRSESQRLSYHPATPHLAQMQRNCRGRRGLEARAACTPPPVAGASWVGERWQIKKTLERRWMEVIKIAGERQISGEF